MLIFSKQIGIRTDSANIIEVPKYQKETIFVKKVLSVVLAAIMAFSLFVIGATAEAEPFDLKSFIENDLPTFPSQEEGKFRIACDYTYITPGETVTVPVYIVSKYNTEFNDPSNCVFVGFSVAVSPSNKDAQIVSVDFSKEMKEFPGFVALEANFNGPATVDTAAFIFKADMSILNQAKLHVADITVKISDNYNIQTKSEVPVLFIQPYDIGFADGTDYFPVEDYPDSNFEGIYYNSSELDTLGAYACFGCNVAIYNGTEVVQSLDYENNEIEFNYGYLIEKYEVPEDEKWEPVIEDAKTFGSNFLDGLNAIWNWIITINDLIKGLLAMI